MRVIVVDDSKTMRNILKSNLTELGYTEVEEACNGQDALTTLKLRCKETPNRISR